MTGARYVILKKFNIDGMVSRNTVRGRSIAGRDGDPQVEVNGDAHLLVRHEASDSGTWRIGTIYVCELRASAARLQVVRNQKASNEPEREAGQPWERLTPGTNSVPPGQSFLV